MDQTPSPHDHDPDTSPTAPVPRDEPPFSSYVILYGGIFLAVAGLGLVMVLLMRFGR